MRRRRAEKRKILPDPKYNNILISNFINVIMQRGKKSLAERIVYGALDSVAKRLNISPPEVLEKAVENVRPLVEVKSRRVGGATYQVPVEVKPRRGISLALRWIRNYALAKKVGPMQSRLARELTDAYNKTGSAVKKREDTHKMAEANKAFSHFRW